MDNEAGKRIEKKLETLTNLVIGMLGSLMAVAMLFSGEKYGGTWQDMSVLMATAAFFITTMYLKKVTS